MILDKIKKEFQRILGAFIFYTTIPFPSKWLKKEVYHSSRYYSFVGVIVGLTSATVFLVSQLFFSFKTSSNILLVSPISILLGMIVAVLITGALHEDGFADTCDGLGGGWTAEERLRIMKDSRIGTYGALGILFLVLFKFFALLQIETEILPWVWISGHTLSRFLSISHLRFLDYVQDPSKSKSGSMTEFSGFDLIVNAAFGLLPLLFVGNQVLVGLSAVVFIWWLTLVHYKKRLGGVTGDCLGATQQLSEVVFYLCLGSNIGV